MDEQEQTPEQRLALEAFAEALADAADTLAELAADVGVVHIKAIGITILTADGWCASNVNSPDGWDRRQDAMFLFNSAKQYAEAAGASITVIEADGDGPIRPLPRNRRRHHRRR